MKIALSVDGTGIAAEVYTPQTEAPPYPAVVVCHGIPSGMPVQGDRGYRPLARKFAEAGLLTVLFNFRGCGESGGNIDLGNWPRDLSAVLDLLEGREDVDSKKISLLGFSGGAAVSCITAASRRMGAVALAACPAEFTFLFPRDKLTEMIARAREIGAIRDRGFPEDPEKWLEGLYGIRPENYIGKLNAPVLIIHGTADDVVPLSHAQSLYSLAAEPKELMLLDGAGHRLRQNPAAEKAVLNWLLRWNNVKEEEYSMLKPGISGEEAMVVAKGNTAIEVGSGSVPVFATPMLVALMENAAINALKEKLPEGQTTVGSKVSIAHTAATPLGMTVTARAELVEVDGRRLLFNVTAVDDSGPVGQGTHERFIVDLAKFLAKVEQKKAGV